MGVLPEKKKAGWYITILAPFALLLLILMELYRVNIPSLFLWDHAADPLRGEAWKLEQEWTRRTLDCRGNTLQIINLLFEGSGQGKIIFRLMEGEAELASWEKEASELAAGQYTQLELPTLLRDVQRRELSLEARAEGDGALRVSEITYVYGTVGRKAIYGFLLLAAAAVLGCAVLAGNRKSWPPERRFLLLAVPVGALYLLVMPFSQSPDDLYHFARIWDIIEGNILSAKVDGSVEGSLPGNLYAGLEFGSNYAQVYASFYQALDKTNFQWYPFANTALYTPIAYLPETAGVWLANLATDRVYFLTMAGRVCGYAFSTFLVYWSIRLAPCRKQVICLIAMVPIFLQEATALGTDYFVNALLLFYIAFLLYLLHGTEGKITWKRMALLTVLSFCVAMCKVVYLPFCLLLFLLPRERFASARTAMLFKTGNLIAAALGNLIWLSLTSGFIDAFARTVNSAEQVKYILANPLRYLMVVYNTVVADGADLVLDVFGRNLGWVANVNTNTLLVLALFLVFCFCGMAEGEKECRIAGIEKTALILVMLAVTLLTFTSLYVQFTDVGQSAIRGLQGRYFIPLLLPVSVVCFAGKAGRSDCGRWLYPFLGYVNITVVIAMVSAFAGGA